MKHYRLVILAIAFVSTFFLTSCRNDSEPTFNWKEQYLAGKIIPEKNPERYTPYLITLDGAGKGDLTTLGKDYTGTYDIKDNTLTFKTDDKEKWFFFTLKDNKATEAKYEVRFKYKDDGTFEPAAVKYLATSFQDKLPSKSSYIGNQYVGDLYKIFTKEVFKPGYIINFNSGTHSYASGDNGHIHFKDYSNVAYKSEPSTGSKEFGIIIDGKLVMASSDSKGFTYFGTFNKK